MGAIVEKVNKEFVINNIEGILIRYNPESNIFRVNNHVLNRNSSIKCIHEVLFVDDIVELSLTKEIEQRKLGIWCRVLNRYHQEMSIPKTNIMKTGLGMEMEEGLSMV